MQEKLDALMRTQAMQLFRQQGLHFTMQQVAEPLHISKKTIYTVYPSKEALLLDMVDHAFAEIHRCKQEILAGGGTLQEKLRAVIIAMPAEYAALNLRQMKELDEKYPASWKTGGSPPWRCWSRLWLRESCVRYPCRCCGR